MTAAFFRATPAALEAALPGWRRPLAMPRSQSGIDPFTKGPTVHLTRDPGDGQVAPPVPASIPFPHAPFLCGGYWWEDLLAFYLWLVPSEQPRIDALFDEESEPELDAVLSRVFPDALFGPSSVQVLAVPDAFTRAAAALAVDPAHEGDDRFRGHAGWQRSGPHGKPFAWLRALGELARSALSQREALFLWGRCA